MLDSVEQEEVFEKQEVKKIVDYVPTPYRKSMWEGIEAVDKNPTFKKIAVEVVAEFSEFDPMFERFDEARFRETEEEDEINVEQPEVSEEMIAEIQKASYEEGFSAGKQEGLTEAQLEIVEKYENLANSMRNISENIKIEIFKKLEELEKKALDLSLDISRRILSTTAEVNPEYILDVIRNGLKNLGASKPLKIRVSLQDFEFLEVVGLPEDLTLDGARIQYVPDDNITNGCIVETDYGELNLELDKMWSEIKNNLFKAIS